MLKVFAEFGLETVGSNDSVSLFTLAAQPVMIDRVIEAHKDNARSQKFIDRALRGESQVWSVGSEGEL